MSSLKPIVLYSHPGPNPWKISILLDELNVPYTSKVFTTPELKQPGFLAIYRNGTSPVIEDPNTGLLLAESGAIIDYIIDQYDKDKTLSFTTMKETYLMKQWLQYQNTAQGPILQNIFRWTFMMPNETACAAYVKDFRRILKVLDDELAERQWLVGDKCSAADLSFVPFHSRLLGIMKDNKPDVAADFPHVEAWYQKMIQRPAVQRLLADHQAVLRSVTLPPGVK